MPNLSQQFLRHIHFLGAMPVLPPADAVAQEMNIALDDLAEMQHEANILGLGEDFFHPSFFRRGRVLRTAELASILANGFNFVPVSHLIREDGTDADPVPEGCACGRWIFPAYGCGHIFREYNMICGATEAAGVVVVAKVCADTSGIVHRAKRRVLGPCGEQGCSWWMDRTAAMGNLATRLSDDYHMRWVWPEP